MYFLIILIGLICAALYFPQMKNECTTRRKQYHKKLGKTAILVHTGKVGEGGRELVNRYPVVSARLTFGRKLRLSPLRVDIPGPAEDKTLSRSAATFYFNDYGQFCIRRSCAKIWVSDRDLQEICLLRDCKQLSAEEVPQIFRRPGYCAPYQEYDGDFCLAPGDYLLIGNTLLEYVEVEHV